MTRPHLLVLLALAAMLTRVHGAAALPAPFARYCFNCHADGKKKGDLVLDGWTNHVAMTADVLVWQRVQKMVAHHEMPPENKPQPTTEERQQMLAWIDAEVFRVDCQKPDPGRVTLRRLNRTEYNNTMRDLLGVDLKPADDFPVDDSGYGFDNIGDALSVSPVLMEKYLGAAQKVLHASLGLHRPAGATTKRYSVDLLEVGYNAKQQGNGWVALNSVEEDDVAIAYEVPASGEYVVRVKAYAHQEGTNAIQLTFMRNQVPLQVDTINTNSEIPQVYQARFPVPAGKQRFRAVVRRDKEGLPEQEANDWKTGKLQKGAVHVQWLEVEGPFNTAPTEMHQRLFAKVPVRGTEPRRAREILTSFAERAYRRPLSEHEVTRLVELAQGTWRDGNSYAEGIEFALQAVLVSPHFLFRGELQPEPDNIQSIHPVNEFALAARLSYFLWSTTPDDILFAQAKAGTLRTNQARQVRRLLSDPKARALVDNFAGQWLQFRNIASVTPDHDRFEAFDAALRKAMQRETELLCETILTEDRSVLEFLTADYTFLNERLARHYGIKDVKGSAFQRVSLQGIPRRGVLTHGSVLTLTSNPTRTSPVKRGKWVLENLLNAPPPPPPPGVPELSEAKEVVLSGTLRQRMEQHRKDPLCSSCHTRMDAIGFGLENFDAIGAWREKDGEFPIDAAGQLSSSATFASAVELVELLGTAKKEEFLRCVTEKMLTYALGRGLEYYDKCAVDKIVAGLSKDARFSNLVLQIVDSVPFQMRRGDGLAERR